MLDIPLMSNNILKSDIDNLVAFLQNTDRFTNGPQVRRFEKAWSEWLGVKYSVFVNSGSSANYITMAALSEIFGGEDNFEKYEIIVPPIAWESDIASVIAAGFKPVFVDVHFHNMAMAEAGILAAITEKTKAVFLTHVLGFVGVSDSLLAELSRRGILLIEDVCESHGAKLGARKAGTLGFASNFSFYYAHHMSTIEGGMICTNDRELYTICRMLRSHGLLRECDDAGMQSRVAAMYSELHSEFIFPVMGWNMRSTELNAVLGLSALSRLDNNIEKRRANFRLFIEHLDAEKFFTDFNLAGSSNYAFVILLREAYKEKFEKLTAVLRNEGVEFRRGTAGGGNLIRQPFVRKRFPAIRPEDYPHAEYIHTYGIYTGNYPDLQQEKILGLCELLNSI